MKRNFLLPSSHYPILQGWTRSRSGFVLMGFKVATMTQLNLFENIEEKPEDYRHKPTGIADFDTFLELNRTAYNTFINLGNPIYLSEIDDAEFAKKLLFKFDSDLQEWVHKPVYNFRINQLLHYIYDYLSERSNHV